MLKPRLQLQHLFYILYVDTMYTAKRPGLIAVAPERILKWGEAPIRRKAPEKFFLSCPSTFWLEKHY